MSDYGNVNTTPDYGNVKADYTPTTERVRNSYANDIACFPKPGDRVRGTIEGVVREDLHALYVTFEHGWEWLSKLQNVEVIPEPIVLPTTPGSIVIIDPTGAHFETFRLTSGTSLWGSHDRRVTADALRCDAEKYGYRIIEAVES